MRFLPRTSDRMHERLIRLPMRYVIVFDVPRINPCVEIMRDVRVSIIANTLTPHYPNGTRYCIITKIAHTRHGYINNNDTAYSPSSAFLRRTTRRKRPHSITGLGSFKTRNRYDLCDVFTRRWRRNEIKR